MRVKRALLLCIMMFLLLSVPASADVLWSPSGMNDYYDKLYLTPPAHVYQDYQVPEGMTVTIYNNPEEGGILGILEAGETIFIASKIERNDTVWGIGGANDTVGWVRLERLQRMYSHEDFLDDYHPDSQYGSIQVSLQEEPIYTWLYPGSGRIDTVLKSEYLSPDDPHEVTIPYKQLYTDPNGGRWGYVGWVLYTSCGWVYLEDPHNPDPPFRLDPVVENTVSDTSPTEEEPHRSPLPDILWAAVLIALVSSVTFLAIYAFKHYK